MKRKREEKLSDETDVQEPKPAKTQLGKCRVGTIFEVYDEILDACRKNTALEKMGWRGPAVPQPVLDSALQFVDMMYDHIHDEEERNCLTIEKCHYNLESKCIYVDVCRMDEDNEGCFTLNDAFTLFESGRAQEDLTQEGVIGMICVRSRNILKVKVEYEDNKPSIERLYRMRQEYEFFKHDSERGLQKN